MLPCMVEQSCGSVDGDTKASRAMVILKTATMSEAVASSLSWGVPGPIASRAASSSTTFGAGTSCTVS